MKSSAVSVGTKVVRRTRNRIARDGFELDTGVIVSDGVKNLVALVYAEPHAKVEFPGEPVEWFPIRSLKVAR